MSQTANRDITILIVDDEEIVLSLVRDALADDGFQIEICPTAETALQLAEKKPIHLVISDIRMPRMNGITLVQKLQEIHPDLAVIFMTGYANLNSAKDAIKQGASDYILKPFELREIREAVGRAVERIRKQLESRQTDRQLDRLSDLGRMLFTVGDKKSLVNISLKFAMMHTDAARGSVIHWNSDRTRFELVIVDGEQIEQETLAPEIVNPVLDELDITALAGPIVIDQVDQHPLLVSPAADGLRAALERCWGLSKHQMIAVPVVRSLSLYGILQVHVDAESLTGSDARLKFLSITAHQLAMSLENLELLEETQQAYGRLKELQDETIQLEKMASKGEMSAEIGHELNNFLGVVAGNLSLLDVNLRKGNFDNLSRYVEPMVSNIEKIKQFTSNLMDLRPIAGTKEVIYFDKILGEVVDYLKPQKRFRGVEISIAPIEQPLPFIADSMKIQQLLYNLFNNAADAMIEQPVKKIEISVTALPGINAFRFVIADTGCGISKELLDKAFHERFTTKEKGHGFGLLVCSRIIESHQGRLVVDSVPGEGTTINIEFPLALVEASAPVSV